MCNAATGSESIEEAGQKLDQVLFCDGSQPFVIFPPDGGQDFRRPDSQQILIHRDGGGVGVFEGASSARTKSEVVKDFPFEAFCHEIGQI